MDDNNNQLAFLKIHLNNDKTQQQAIPNFELKEICWFQP
jgi:hypothetical protein